MSFVDCLQLSYPNTSELLLTCQPETKPKAELEITPALPDDLCLVFVRAFGRSAKLVETLSIISQIRTSLNPSQLPYLKKGKIKGMGRKLLKNLIGQIFVQFKSQYFS